MSWVLGVLGWEDIPDSPHRYISAEIEPVGVGIFTTKLVPNGRRHEIRNPNGNCVSA